MKKIVFVVFVVVALAAAGGGWAAWHHHKMKQQAAASAKAKPNDGLLEACDVLTLSDAKQILGPNAKAGNGNGIGDAESDDAKVSNCTYTKTGASVGDGVTIGLLARVSKTTAGAESNHAEFGTNKPAGVAMVQGYGDAAFWDQSKGQLSILKGNNWFIVSKLTGIHPEQTQLADVEAIAKLALARMR